MGSQYHAPRGQAVIEATLIIVVVLTLIFMAMQMTVKLQALFHHHHLDDGPLKSKDLPFEIQWNNSGLVFFKNRDLKEKGWRQIEKYKFNQQEILLLEKDGEELLQSHGMGVISCTKNCG